MNKLSPEITQAYANELLCIIQLWQTMNSASIPHSVLSEIATRYDTDRVAAHRAEGRPDTAMLDTALFREVIALNMSSSLIELTQFSTVRLTPAGEVKVDEQLQQECQATSTDPILLAIISSLSSS